MFVSNLGIIQEISVSKVHHPANQIRMTLNIEELALSIRQQGLLQPIVVRPKNHKYEVVAGNRRLEAVRSLKLRKISCHIVELSDREAYEVALVENVHHKTMNPIEEATAFQKYVESYGWGGISDLASRIGKSQEYVTKRLQLLRLPEKVQLEIIRQRITVSSALEMLPLDQSEIHNLMEYVIKNPLTRDEIRQAVKTARRRRSTPLDEVDELDRQFNLNEKDLALLDNALKKCIAIMKSTLVNFDDVLESVGEDWIIKELLMQYRLIMHGDIDTFLKLRKRLRTRIPKGYAIVRNKRFNDNDSDEFANNLGIHMWNPRGVWQ
jgi:ParB family transcriptional regulator, chromosome partitioning protein